MKKRLKYNNKWLPVILASLVLFCLIGITPFALADGEETGVEFFSLKPETIFNSDDGCPYYITVPADTANVRLFLEDFNIAAGDAVLIASTFEGEISEDVSLLEIKEVDPEGGKYVEEKLLKNGIYSLKAYRNEEQQHFASGELYFRGIDFSAPAIGAPYGEEWVVYDGFYFEGQNLVLIYTVDDTKTPVRVSAASGIKEINIYYSEKYYKDNIDLQDLELIESINDFSKHNVSQKYEGEFKVDKVGFYYFQSMDWVGNSQTFEPFEYKASNTDNYIFLANVTAGLQSEDYSLLLKSHLQDAYDYYREMAANPNKTEEADEALTALIAEWRAYEEAVVTTELSVIGEQIIGIQSNLAARHYAQALKGDKLKLEINAQQFGKDYSVERVISLIDGEFTKGYKINPRLYFNNNIVLPSNPITIYIPKGEEYTCKGVIGYSAADAQYTSLPFNEGDKWITFEYEGAGQEYIVFLADKTAKDNAWVLWLIIGVGLGMVAALSVYLVIRYKKQEKIDKAAVKS